MENNIRKFQDDEIDLVELFHVLLRKWWLIALCAIIGGGAALGVTVGLITPMYESNAMLYILNKTTTVTSLADIQMGSALTEDFAVIATSKPVIDGAIERIKKDEEVTFTRSEVQKMLTVTNKADTRILVITATDADPKKACMVANAVAKETASQMAEIMKSDPPTTVEQAEVAENPVSPNVMKNTAVGFMAGIVLICGILVLRHLMNDNIKTEEDVERYLGVPVLASIPYNKEHEKEAGDKKRQLKSRKEAKNE